MLGAIWESWRAICSIVQLINFGKGQSYFGTQFRGGQSGTTQHGGRKVGNKKKSGKHPTFYHPEPRPTTPAAYVGHINVFIPKLKY